MCTASQTNKQTKPPTHNPPNETVRAAPVCPPERPRSGVSIPKIHASRTGNERRMRPCGATRAGTQAPPLPISTKLCTRCAHTHRGYTFDSAGLASATQPTLGNGGQQGGYPQRGLYFLSPQTNDAAPHANDAAPCTIHPNETHKQSPHTTIGGGNASRTPAPSTLNEWNFMILASP